MANFQRIILPDESSAKAAAEIAILHSTPITIDPYPDGEYAIHVDPDRAELFMDLSTKSVVSTKVLVDMTGGIFNAAHTNSHLDIEVIVFDLDDLERKKRAEGYRGPVWVGKKDCSFDPDKIKLFAKM